MWRTTKLTILWIAFRLSIPSVLVFNIVHKYKSLVKKIIKDKIAFKNKKNDAISIGKLDKMHTFWALDKNKVIHIEDTKEKFGTLKLKIKSLGIQQLLMLWKRS